jgi:hypothetical protein
VNVELRRRGLELGSDQWRSRAAERRQSAETSALSLHAKHADCTLQHLLNYSTAERYTVFHNSCCKGYMYKKSQVSFHTQSYPSIPVSSQPISSSPSTYIFLPPVTLIVCPLT